jgi:osmoprotectant transport system ATP-binding protein
VTHALEFRNVCYSVDGRTILDHVSFTVDRGETLVLLGRSGSGKTSALRLINRMLDATSGTVLLDGKDVRESDPVTLRRHIGYVIQEFGLLPHWTVSQNVALVPRLLRWPVPKQIERSNQLLRTVGLEPSIFALRYPNQLSGGQRQRVGVARALAAEPEVLLFDEPFGALDPITRHEMQQLFLQVRDQYNGASVFVTHDLLEALALGTRIAVLEQGRLEGVFTADEFRRATTPYAMALLSTLPPGVSLT